MVESTVIFLVMAGIVLGTLDLGIGIFRYHVVSEAARQGARQAIVHGSLAPPQAAQWGPTTVTSPASASGVPLVDAVSPLLVGFDLTQTQVTGEWIDGASDPGKRVRVTVSTPYRPMITFVFGNPSYTLTGSSTMPVTH
jgi:Flp pilus assembly protein TadG